MTTTCINNQKYCKVTYVHTYMRILLCFAKKRVLSIYHNRESKTHGVMQNFCI